MDRAERILLRVAWLSIAAGLVHGIVTPDHFAEWWGYGLFFLFASFAQVLYGAVPLFARLVEGEPLMTQWSQARLRAYCITGVAGNVAIILLYVVTRTVGIPFFGPAAGVVEEVRVLDVVSKLLEVGVIAGLALLLARSTPRAASA